MKTFYKINNGIMRVKETSNDEAKPSDGWKETKNIELFKHDGEPAEYFNKDMRIPDDELVKQGKRIDKRGLWYNKKNRKQKNITDLDEEIDENLFTKEVPIDGENYQIFENGKWVVDTEKKDLSEKQKNLDQLKSEIISAEQRQIRSLKAIIAQKANKKDQEAFDKYEDIINGLRPKITKLEAELESA